MMCLYHRYQRDAGERVGVTGGQAWRAAFRAAASHGATQVCSSANFMPSQLCPRSTLCQRIDACTTARIMPLLTLADPRHSVCTRSASLLTPPLMVSSENSSPMSAHMPVIVAHRLSWHVRLYTIASEAPSHEAPRQLAAALPIVNLWGLPAS